MRRENRGNVQVWKSFQCGEKLYFLSLTESERVVAKIREGVGEC